MLHFHRIDEQLLLPKMLPLMIDRRQSYAALGYPYWLKKIFDYENSFSSVKQHVFWTLGLDSSYYEVPLCAVVQK